jgi:membrane protein required for beta-lactamase induction
MNFVALLLGLGIERLLTHLFHLREFRWLDPLFDWVTERLREQPRGRALAGVVLAIGLAVAPVAIVSDALSGALYQVPYFVLAVLVLLFSLGPRDLKTEVDEYCVAVRSGNGEEADRLARELWEGDIPSNPGEQTNLIRRAVFIQANNRIFGTVFWFLILGPTGAWLFRVLDLMRRRLAFRYNRSEQDFCNTALVWAVRAAHGVLAWLPARLLVLGYGLAGSFDGALSAWRAYSRPDGGEFYRVTNDVLDLIGNGAAGGATADSMADSEAFAARVAGAMDLVVRTLWLIWCPAIALMTLTDWLN